MLRAWDKNCKNYLQEQKYRYFSYHVPEAILFYIAVVLKVAHFGIYIM